MTRVAFVGQRMYFASCSMTAPAAGIQPHFVHHVGGGDQPALLARLKALDPDVVVVFRPEIVAPGLLGELRATTLGFNTEPLPRTADGRLAHPDQLTRLSELAEADAGQFDRLITFDPLSGAAAEHLGLPLWRSLPLPVADELYAPLPLREPRRPNRILFLGYATEHREHVLIDAKHHYDVLHVAWGMHGDALRELLHSTDVALNVHVEPYPSFENRVCLHLAAGNLVLSEPLSPRHGLEPGIDYVELRSRHRLTEAVGALRAHPELHRGVRLRGRRKAEQFRASRVWPRVLSDLQLDVAAFGGRRALAR